MTISRSARLLLLAGALIALGAACGAKTTNTNEAVNATVNTIVNKLPDTNSVTTGTFSTTPTNE